MKKVITTIAAAIIAIILTNVSSYGKTKTMTAQQFTLRFCKVDTKLVGTWEKNISTGKADVMHYCQFNANGTYLAFEKNKKGYAVTGRGSWKVENGKISILHGGEASVPVTYEEKGNVLIFGTDIAYTRPGALYANK